MSNNRLLIVDDEPEIGAYVSAIARRCNYETSVVTTGDAFCARVNEWAPTHVVLDLQLAETDGVQLLRFLAAQRSRARILILSGFDEKMLETARLLGVERGLDIAGTLNKPIRAAALLDVLNALSGHVDEIDAAAVAAAIENREFVLAFQPKVKMGRYPDRMTADASALGFEALLRWRHPRRGIVAPGAFIGLAEEAGLMGPLTDIVVGLALEQLRRWSAGGIQVPIAINISAQNLRDPAFTDTLTQRCAEAGVSPRLLTIELTETATMTDAALAMDTLMRLRIKGFQLSIDDFGTGYSSLAILQRLPFSELKIDRTFIRDCHVSNQSRIMVRTMVDLAHNLGLTAIAEGVENSEILEVVQQLGCDYAQGYHIGRPQQAAAANRWIRECCGVTGDVGD